MFRVKICGLTDLDDARMVSAAGADALGLNFYPRSKRFISLETAARIVEATPASVARVGLFVNATDDEVCTAYDHLGLDFIQLHGDEPPEYLLSLGGRPVIRAFRLGPGGLGPIREYLAACCDPGVNLQGILIDAYDPDHYGGTGVVADWERLAAERSQLGDLPLVLAGGLDEKNVGDAISRVHPDAVDVASGVECAPGRKDAVRVEDFVREAVRAFARSD